MNANKLYVQIIGNRPVEKFLQRFFIIDEIPQNLIIVSPIICTLQQTRYSIIKLIEKITRDKIITYVITREPEELFHKEAINILYQSDFVEIRYNNSLHAKLYISAYQNEYISFALLGSANLTRHSIEKNIEIGIMIFRCGTGRNLWDELFQWGLVRLRTLPESKLVKKIKKGGKNGI